jgi:AcrR family transcriptional regulator
MPASDRSYPSVWARPPRKERSTLTREQIVAEALRLLDTDGIAALSMRKLAAGLGAGATSLYWHVANRDELIELVIDEIYGELDLPGGDELQDWQAACRRMAQGIRSAVVGHPWMVSVLDHLVAAYLGPNSTRATEHMLAVFEAAGFELAEAERALNAVSAYVIGSAMGEAAFHNWLTRHGQTQQDWVDEALRIAEDTTEGHDRLRAVVATYAGKDPQQAMDEDFDYGLDRILDGLQSRLDALGPG